jgi:hypothetical protein
MSYGAVSTACHNDESVVGLAERAVEIAQFFDRTPQKNRHEIE